MQRTFRLALFFLLALLSLTYAVQAAYIDNGNTVTDTVTGLEWQKATAPGTYNWHAALAYCEGLTLAGKSDWRLPDKNELLSLMDYSRYSPAIAPVFTIPQSSNYWSSTNYLTTFGFAGAAWVVDFYYALDRTDGKSASHYVRAVRGGQSGAFGGFDYFAFDQIGAVATGAPVQVTVRAMDKSGQPMTGFSGPVTLLSDAQRMRIDNSTQAAGVTVFTVSFAESSAGNRLHAQSASMTGDSNSFAVGNGESEVGAVKGRVVHTSGASHLDTVHLQDSTHDFQTVTINGNFEFPASHHIPKGRYLLWVEFGGIRYGHSVSLGTGVNLLLDLFIRATKPPVILVPGFMGSNQIGNSDIYPALPKHIPANQYELVLHDPLNYLPDLDWMKNVGWKKLRADLEAAGFEVYDCPWDWRLAPDHRDAQAFLKSTIALAKSETGAVKVDVVAHSMGGLLTRAYIQGNTYAGDIDRFAMVGTPNHGSLLAYPLWEGGDAVLADFMAGTYGGYGCNLNPASNIGDYFYSNTLDKLWNKMKGGHVIKFYKLIPCELRPEPKLIKERSEIREFLDTNVAGLGSLLITDDYCLNSSSSTCGQISHEYENDFLIKLNGDPNLNRLSNGTVNTKIFASNSEEVVKNVNVKIEAGNIFLDGEPQRPFTFTKFSGDGTVLLSSALLGSVPHDVPANMGDHGFLVNKFRPEIKAFLTDGRSLSPAPSPLVTAMDAGPAPDSADSTASLLSLSVNNGCAPLLTGPDNARNGIDLETGVDYQEGANTALFRDGNAASVSLVDPAAGVYQVKLTGTLAGPANIVIAWLSENKQDELAVDLYYHPTATTFRLQVDPAAVPVLSLVADIGAPQELAAENSSGNTLLRWSAPLVGTPVSYKVYSQQDFQNSLTPLTTVSAPATSLTTTHPYNSPRRLYAVSAVDAQGNESVLSDIIDNQPVAITSHEMLVYDHDGDGDVDGVDLVDFIVNGTVNEETLGGFAKEFGMVGGQ